MILSKFKNRPRLTLSRRVLARPDLNMEYPIFRIPLSGPVKDT